METFDFHSLLSSGEKRNTDTILTIGVFDGLHLAHQDLLAEMCRMQAKMPGTETMVITFSSNPKPGKERNLDTLSLRAERIAEFGINSFVVIDFSPEFSRISSGRFVDMLMELCRPVAMVVGDDFKFGNPAAAANATELSDMFRERGREVEVVIKQAILTEGGEKISSTLVRRVIDNGRMECIFRLTGHSYQVDLKDCEFKVDRKDVVICRNFIHQLLPPVGDYEADLKLPEGKVRVTCTVSEETLRLGSGELERILEGKDGEAMEGMQLNSIYFGEQK